MLTYSCGGSIACKSSQHEFSSDASGPRCKKTIVLPLVDSSCKAFHREKQTEGEYGWVEEQTKEKSTAHQTLDAKTHRSGAKTHRPKLQLDIAQPDRPWLDGGSHRPSTFVKIPKIVFTWTSGEWGKKEVPSGSLVLCNYTRVESPMCSLDVRKQL